MKAEGTGNTGHAVNARCRCPHKPCTHNNMPLFAQSGLLYFNSEASLEATHSFSFIPTALVRRSAQHLQETQSIRDRSHAHKHTSPAKTSGACLARIPSTSVTRAGSSYLGICRATFLRQEAGDQPPTGEAELNDDATSGSLVGG